MALQSQFSLSVELTKLVPFGSLITTTSRGLVNLVRELHKSGSDIVAEQDLAEIFGRNRIEDKFVSTFRTAVRTSAIQRLSEIAEVVLEAGAGPTVKRSLNDQAYTSTIIQLSLLTWSHELDSLARALAKALERRVQGSDGYHEFPSKETLKGTLRACRQQTSGFLWELMFIAVEIKLRDIGYEQMPYHSRPIPYYILQALLDAFTAVQYFPDERLIRIETWAGLVTIVVWAHYLLGLTVGVRNEDKTICFGLGHEQVWIDCELRAHVTKTTCFALLDAAQEVHFSLSPNPAEEPDLEPACRHPALGYGNRILSFDVEDRAVIRELAHHVVVSCLLVVKEALEQGQAEEYSNVDRLLIPSKRQILDAGSLLFGDLDYSPIVLDHILNQPCLLKCSWEPNELPELVRAHIGSRINPRLAIKKTFKRLCNILLAFANVLDVAACSGLPLDIYPGLPFNQVQTRLPTISESFETLSKLLLGHQYDEEKVRRAALLSSWGWSIFFSSVSSQDPCHLLSEICIRHGVPCRFGERKEWILDSDNRQLRGYGNPTDSTGESQCAIVARAGDTVALQNLSRARRLRSWIDVSGSAFEVLVEFECDADRAFNADRYISLRLGFRGLQELWWRAFRLPYCSHPVKIGDEAIVPDDMVCFSGLTVHSKMYRGDLEETMASDNGWVHIGMVAGNPSARWILLANMLSWLMPLNPKPNVPKQKPGVVFWRGNDCCLACAMNTARDMRNGRIVGVVL